MPIKPRRRKTIQWKVFTARFRYAGSWVLSDYVATNVWRDNDTIEVGDYMRNDQRNDIPPQRNDHGPARASAKPSVPVV
jgi:hypothetical protein